MVTRLPADTPPPILGQHAPGSGEIPTDSLIVDDTGRLDGTLGAAETDAALVEVARTCLLAGTSRTVELAGVQLFIEAYPARPRLVVVGAVEIARNLVRLASELGYETVVIDGRASFLTDARFPDADRLVLGWPDEAAEEIALGSADAVAILTHDVKFDEPAIIAALARGCRYVGAVGSRRPRLSVGPVCWRRACHRRTWTGSTGPSVWTWAGGCRPRPPSRSWPRSWPSAGWRGPPDAGPRPRTGGVSLVRVVAVVLAAGSSSRFGSPKLLAPLDGRPILQHALDALAAADVDDVAVVLGDEQAAVETAIAWRGERRVVNERPGDGLSSSLRVGLDAAAEDPSAEAVLVVLGDQPSLQPGVIRTVLGAAEASLALFVRARHAADGVPNPVLVRRAAWAMAAGLAGDRGLGPLLAARPELVLEVAVEGASPDVDTPDDLAALQSREAVR